LIRGLSSTPGAYTSLDGRMLKIYLAAGEPGAAAAAGTIGAVTKKGLPVAAANGWVYLQEVQLEGKNRMAIPDFLRGYRLPPQARCR